MRNYLVTRFACSVCGNSLDLSYNKEKSANGNDYVSDGITGACKVEDLVIIEPCKTCIEKPKSELETLRKIISGR